MCCNVNQLTSHHIVLSTLFLLLQHYKERDLIQPLHWPLNSSYPLLYHQFIYFFTSKENRNTFMLNPLKYLRQPKPSSSLPVRIAVVGPPKSGKTTGRAQHALIPSKLFYCTLSSFFLFSIFVLFTVFFAPVAEMFANKYGLARLSIGSVMRMVLKNEEHTDLAVQLQMHLSQGLAVPDEVAIQCLEVVLMGFCCARG